MSDEKVEFRASDLVWVKLSGCWWPGEVQDLKTVPEEVKEDLGDDCLAVVKFFDEDYYEPIYDEKDAYPYNCSQRQEFIEKGMARYRSKAKEGSNLLKKLPEDLKKAQELTGGPTEIIDELMNAPKVSKISYSQIFAPTSNKRKATVLEVSPKPSKKTKDEESKNKQGNVVVKTAKAETPKVKVESAKKLKNTKQTSQMSVDLSGSNGFQCEYCNFCTNRLNVIILHRKSHSDGVIPIEKKPEIIPTETSKRKKSKAKEKLKGDILAVTASPSDTAFDTLVGMSTSQLTVHVPEISKDNLKKVESPPKPTPRKGNNLVPIKSQKKSGKRKVGTPSKSTSLLAEYSTKKSPSKRALQKKVVSSDEIKSKLLADWDDDEELATPINNIDDSGSENETADNILVSVKSDDEDEDIKIKSYKADVEDSAEGIVEEDQARKLNIEIANFLESAKIPEVELPSAKDLTNGDTLSPKGTKYDCKSRSEDAKDQSYDFSRDMRDGICSVSEDVKDENTATPKDIKDKSNFTSTDYVNSDKEVFNVEIASEESDKEVPKIIVASETEPATHPTESILNTCHLKPVHKALPVPADFSNAVAVPETKTVTTTSIIASSQEGSNEAVIQQELAVPPPPIVMSQAVVLQDGQIVAPTDINGETYVFVALDDADTANFNGATFVAYAETGDAANQTFFVDSDSLAQSGVLLGIDSLTPAKQEKNGKSSAQR
ncbi:uncharacterized protein LOC136033079 [Artemia franciscana]|uniref:PWWP domain-containing protein n=1 Tax=Artemia franciscana TaxID=6661 RepID=A0AA88IA53_ARTSF|nr:hypothetical protein QYM36_001278 [Artemia franciscana]